MKTLVVGIVVAILLALGAFAFVNSQRNQSSDRGLEEQSNENATSNQSGQNEDAIDLSQAQDSITITYTDSGFSPSEARLKVGGGLTWVNNSSSAIQIGVDPHPTHTGDKAITGGEFVTTLNPGETKTITVNKTGKFGYHNHLDSFKVGKVVVE